MNKEELENKVWSCLREDEQQCLTLSISFGKSIHEIGETLGLAHYKCIELKERSEKMMILFRDYFLRWDSLVRPNSHLDDRFIDFIESCLEKRFSRKDASMAYGDSAQLIKSINNKFLRKQMNLLKKSEYEQDIDLWKLIMEFDRWNNWRILPRELQQPSAYKRRINRRDKFYLKYICKLPEDKVQILIDKFWFKGRKNKAYFVAFSYDRFDEGYFIIPVKNDPVTLEKLSRLFIYVFKTEDEADRYGFLVSRYQYGEKEIKSAQTFWPDYRYLVSNSLNFKDINNMDFYNGVLDMAYEIKYKKNKK